MSSRPFGRSRSSIGGFFFGSSFFFQNVCGSSCVFFVSLTSALSLATRIRWPSSFRPDRYPSIKSAQTSRADTFTRASEAASMALVARRTRSLVNGSSHASSKSFTPQTEPLARVPPDPEVLHVQVAYGEQHVLVSIGKPRAHTGPLLNPPVECRPQEGKRSLAHLAVFLFDQLPRDVGPLPHPRLERIGGIDHATHATPLF